MAPPVQRADMAEVAPPNLVAPVFYPTMKQMRQPFEKFVESIEEEAAPYGMSTPYSSRSSRGMTVSDSGICKIVPPREWRAASDGKPTMFCLISLLGRALRRILSFRRGHSVAEEPGPCDQRTNPAAHNGPGRSFPVDSRRKEADLCR